jgi:hypothetical protein
MGSMPIILSTWALCILIERLCLWSGKVFNIWKIDESIERLEGEDESFDLGKIFRQLDKRDELHRLRGRDTPNHVRFHIN